MTDFQPQMDFLTPEESAEVDGALMTARDRFSTRVALYSLRSLKQIAQEAGVAIADLSPNQIEDWIYQDPSLQPENGFDSGFKGFFTQLVMSSLKPLRQISEATGQPIEELTLSQVVKWFEQEAKAKLGG
jgi:type II secretory pathway component PulK